MSTRLPLISFFHRCFLSLAGAVRALLKRRLSHFVLLVCITTGASQLLHKQEWGWWTFIDTVGLDCYFRLRGQEMPQSVGEKLPQSKDIVLLQTSHQLPRALIAKLLHQLRMAKVVAFDMMFVDSEAQLQPDDLSPQQKQQWYGPSIKAWRADDALLSRAIRDHGRVILGMWPEESRADADPSTAPNTKSATGDLETGWSIPSPVIWNAARYHAHVLVAPDVQHDDVVRYVRLSDGDERTGRVPALGLAIAAAADGISPQQLQREIDAMNPEGGMLKLGTRGVWYGRGGIITIDYLGGRRCFEDGGNLIVYQRALDEDFSDPLDFQRQNCDCGRIEHCF
jgi:hypothetical protein